MLRSLLFVVLLSGLLLPAQAQWSGARPDGHAPIGVMGDHTHGKGEFMVSYRFMYMNMDGNRIGTNPIDASDVVRPEGSNFIVSPTQMPMQMHMFGAMYAPTDALTLVLMVPYLVNDMDHLTRAGGSFSTASSGLGDVSLGALYELAFWGDQRLHANLGVRLPTGSIEESDVTPASAPNETQLPYPMQLGSGTVDVQPGLTYLGQSADLSWGGQVTGTFRLGENDQEYTLGNRLDVTAWSAVQFSPWFSASARAAYAAQGNIDGASPVYEGAVAMRMVPTVFTNLRGGERLDIGPGINLYAPDGALAGLRLAAEVLVPVYQNLDGPQLETDVTFTLGLQYAL